MVLNLSHVLVKHSTQKTEEDFVSILTVGISQGLIDGQVKFLVLLWALVFLVLLLWLLGS